MLIESRCKCERCGKEYTIAHDLWDSKRIVNRSDDYCPTCNTLWSMMLYAWRFGEKRNRMNTEDPMELNDYVCMCWFYAKGLSCYHIAELFRLPESVVRAIIFDVKDGETARAVDVRGALSKTYGVSMKTFPHAEEGDK